MNSPTLEIEGRVAGLVQGVGYRAFATRQAARLGVTGWVKNLADGSVGFLAQGPEVALAAFLAALREGPRWAQVEKVDILRSEPLTREPFPGFNPRF